MMLQWPTAPAQRPRQPRNRAAIAWIAALLLHHSSRSPHFCRRTTGEVGKAAGNASALHPDISAADGFRALPQRACVLCILSMWSITPLVWITSPKAIFCIFAFVPEAIRGAARPQSGTFLLVRLLSV
jgi:hypothetical protein